MSVQINGTNGIVFNDASTQNTAATGFGFKNRIFNGSMVIDQRNAGASGTSTGYTIDRWGYYNTQASKGTWQQNAGSVTPPAGFKNYLGFTSSSAYSVLSTDIFEFYQFIEGLNSSDLGFGASGASTVTLSFWVRSSLTGTFGGCLANNGNTRNYPFTYTISNANTWEQKSITIAGDTTGTWLTTNGIGVAVGFSLGAGSSFSGTANAWNGTTNALFPTGATSVVGTNGATFYITGVQLEKGSTATSFDYRPYGTELALCQRYYEVVYKDTGIGPIMGAYLNATNYVALWCFKQEKRASPTVALASGASWSGTTPTIYPAVSATGFNTSGAYWSNATTGNVFLTASAEL